MLCAGVVLCCGMLSSDSSCVVSLASVVLCRVLCNEVFLCCEALSENPHLFYVLSLSL